MWHLKSFSTILVLLTKSKYILDTIKSYQDHAASVIFGVDVEYVDYDSQKLTLFHKLASLIEITVFQRIANTKC